MRSDGIIAGLFFGGLILVIVALCVLMVRDIRSDVRDRSACRDACFPAVSKVIDDSCYCAAVDGSWVPDPVLAGR